MLRKEEKPSFTVTDSLKWLTEGRLIYVEYSYTLLTVSLSVPYNTFFFKVSQDCCSFPSVRTYQQSHEMWSGDARLSHSQNLVFADGRGRRKEETETREKQGSSSAVPKQKEGTDRLPSKGEFMTRS